MITSNISLIKLIKLNEVPKPLAVAPPYNCKINKNTIKVIYILNY